MPSTCTCPQLHAMHLWDFIGGGGGAALSVYNVSSLKCRYSAYMNMNLMYRTQIQ